MASNLAKVMSHVDLNKLASGIIGTNKKTGARFVRAVGSDGSLHIRIATKTGAKIFMTIATPAIKSIRQRNDIIKDLVKNGIPQFIAAAATNVSPSTASRVMRKK